MNKCPYCGKEAKPLCVDTIDEQGTLANGGFTLEQSDHMTHDQIVEDVNMYTVVCQCCDHELTVDDVETMLDVQKESVI